jgi:hypothetical protein
MGDLRVQSIGEQIQNTSEGKDNRIYRVTVRFRKAEYAQVKNYVEISGLTTVAFVRKRVLGQRIASKADLAVLAELRRLGGLLKHVHNESRGAYSALTAQTIRDLSAYVRALTAKNHDNAGSEASS